jgi:hypothetical protein
MKDKKLTLALRELCPHSQVLFPLCFKQWLRCKSQEMQTTGRDAAVKELAQDS